MNRDLALSGSDNGWAVQPYHPSAREYRQDFGPTLDFASILRIIREWRWIILAGVAAGLALAVVYTMIVTPMYRASVILQVNPPTVQILDESTGGQSEGARPYDFVATQVGLLSSRSLAERVSQDLNLASNPKFVPQTGDPTSRLQGAADEVSTHLHVIAPEDGDLISFSYESPSPALAAQIANGLSEAFIDSNLQRRYESSAYARNFLQRQIAKTRTDLEKSERELVSYAQAEGIINTSSDQSGNPLESDANSPQGQALTETNRALSDATAQRVAAEGAYRAAISGGITSTENESTQVLRQSRASLEAQYQQKRILMKPEHPEMVSLRSQIAELDRQIARENLNVESGRINTLENAYQAAVAAENALKSKVSQLKGEVLNLRGRSIRYAILQRDVDTNRALYDALLQRYKQIGVVGGIDTAPVSIVDRADVPTEPFKPNLPMNLLIGLIFGFTAGIAAAVALEYLNDTIRTRDDVRTKLGLACLGTIPKVAGKADFIDELKDSGSGISEAYSTVAASLGFSTESGVPKVLLLTSARPSEGKSSSALALAQNFARRGRSVLLIDCDFRKPAFKSSSENGGMTELLTNHEPISGHISPTHFENLSLLPAGPIPPNPADLLSTDRFGAIVRQASAQYDIVIIDAPPVVGLADAPLIAATCNDVIYIIESGKTRTSTAREAINKLQSAGAHIIGVTLTKSTEGRRGSGYGYGYGYGDKYGALDKDRTSISLIRGQSDA